MSDEQHPLTETQYDIIGQQDDHGKYDEDITVDIPEVITLDTIVQLSLDAYKQQMETLAFVDPAKRQFFLETANKFLKEAKDAAYKRDYLKLQLEKNKASKSKSNGQNSGSSDAQEESDADADTPRTYTRTELLQMNKKAN